jgi:hypothetical protein
MPNAEFYCGDVRSYFCILHSSLSPPFLPQVRSAVCIIVPDDHDNAVALGIDNARMNDAPIARGPVEDPAPCRGNSFDATTALRFRLLPWRPAREPEPALADAWIMTGRNAKPATVLVVADDDDPRRRWGMAHDGHASGEDDA